MEYLLTVRMGLAGMFVLLMATTGCNEQSEADNPAMPADYPRQLIAEGASLTKVTEEYKFDTAGSPLYLNGDLYFTNNNFDQPEQSRTLRRSSAGQIDTLVSNNGVVTALQASGQGTIYACEMLGHRVVELTANGEVVRVVAEEYAGRRIDGPNDIVVDSKGGLYFSDSQFIAGREKMQETPAVYYVSPMGEVLRVIDDIAFPNGMGISPDGNTLYVANTTGPYLLAYDVNEDGTVDNGRNFARLELAEGSEESGADGMALDEAGNIYVATTQGLGVQVFDPGGTHLGNISVNSPTNNVSFGGRENTMLYISALDGIYSIRTRVAGFISINQ